MTTSRRDFLLQAAGAPLVLGLPGCKRVDSPKWLEPALARMREQGRFGLLFRVPAAPKARCALGHSLTRHLLNSQDPDVHELLLEAVVLCLDDAAVRGRVRSARTSDTLLLIDGDGYAVDGLAFDPGDDWVNFVPAARALLHGPGGRRLAERARWVRQGAPREILALAAKPEVDSSGSLVPLLVQERMGGADGPRQEALREALETHWQGVAAAPTGPRMPYGVETTAQMKGACGNCGCEEAPKLDLLPPCGMAIAIKNSRHFVRFLGK